MIAMIAVIVFMVVIFPIGFLLSGAVVAGLLGWLHTADAEERYEGSELLPLSRT